MRAALEKYPSSTSGPNAPVVLSARSSADGTEVACSASASCLRAPAGLRRDDDGPARVDDGDRGGGAAPPALELRQIDLHLEDAELLLPVDDHAAETRLERAGHVLVDGEDGVGAAHGFREERALAMQRAELLAVRRRHRPPVEVEHPDRRRPDLVDIGDQALAGGREVARVERCDQGRVARQKKRHDRVPLKLRQDGARIQGLPQLRALPRRLDETLREQGVDDRDGDPGRNDDEHDHNAHRPGQPRQHTFRIGPVGASGRSRGGTAGGDQVTQGHAPV